MSSENKQSAVVNMVELEQKLHIAYRGGLRTIAHIIPWLEQREMTARKYFSPGIDSEGRKQCAAMINHINEEIKKIMGL